jgi:iron(III) transport system substrate-binding protein
MLTDVRSRAATGPALRRSFAVATAALLLVGLTACGASGPSITLYNGQHEQTTDALVAQFEKQTHIQVNVRSDDEAVLASQIDAEGSNSPADVVYTENSPALEYLAERHRLAALPASVLAATPARYDSPTGDWVGVSARVSVLVYNTRLLTPAELPASVLALAQPRFKGKLALAPDETDFQPIVTAVARAYGPAAALTWLEALKANASGHIYPDNETITDEVNRGDAAIGIINQYYWYRERAQVGASNVHSAIAFLAPLDPGYVVDVSGAGVLSSSSHRADAERFVAFLVSKEGQEILAHSDSFEYPIASGVTLGPGQTPLSALRPDPIDLAALGDGSAAVALLRQAQLL